MRYVIGSERMGAEVFEIPVASSLPYRVVEFEVPLGELVGDKVEAMLAEDGLLVVQDDRSFTLFEF